MSVSLCKNVVQRLNKEVAIVLVNRFRNQFFVMSALSKVMFC